MDIFIKWFFFFFNDTATTEIYTLSLHDALPIYLGAHVERDRRRGPARAAGRRQRAAPRSEEHTSELQSRPHLVCRLLLEKKKTQYFYCAALYTISCRPSPSHVSE